MLQTYQRIRELAPVFAQATLQAARSAHNEAEFERRMNNEIERLAQQLGVDFLVREQYTLATGRADAVYNRFVIEYESPGSLRTDLKHGHTAHAVQQVKDYIEGLAKEEHHDRDRLLGVAFDGHFFIFVRYHQGHWIVEEPLPVNAVSCERFLRSLFSLSSGRALIPENLVEDFGNQNPLSQEVTCALYHALSGHSNDLTARLFEQWKLFFGETAGYEAAAGKLQHKAELCAFLQGMGLKPEQTDMPRFFFALQTYFAFIVKNIARLVLQAYAGGALGATPLTTVASLAGDALRHELRNLESGGFFRTLGLKNLLEGDFFAWYLDAWDASVEAALGQVLQRLADYNPVTVQDDPHSARDLLKKLYHYLLPREIRHDLGEFYTPDWLAEHLLAQLDEPLFQMPKSGHEPAAVSPLSPKRLLDPACGSGTFLVLAARALKANCQQAGLAEADTLEFILHSLAGLDLNPLAVMAARVNFLLAIADLLPYRRREVELPIYLADSILTPTLGQGLWEHNRRILETAVGPLPLPLAVDSRAKIEKLTDLPEEYVTGGFEAGVFLQRCCRELSDLTADSTHENTLRELFECLHTLHRKGLDGIWARVIKNAFMPLFLEPFDYIVGNPPWINWESLPQAYRDRSAPLWQELGLFVHSGMDTILGKGKKDLSTLMTYAVIASFLKSGGKLGFVITQSVWKTSGAGQGFRRLKLPSPPGRGAGGEGLPLRVLHVDDLSRLQVFEGASTRTSVFVLQKGQPTSYPVDYTYWQETSKGRGLDYDSTLEEVLAKTRSLQFHAVPVDPTDPTSAWLTARPKALQAVQKVLGKSEYRAYEGANSGGANAVYWLEKVDERPDGLWIVRNVTEGAKRKVEAVTVEIEPDLLYPLLRGRDVQRWLAQPSAYLLMTQDPKLRRGLDPKTMQSRYPKTWTYLKRFEAVLRERSGFKRYFTRKQGKQVIETGPFYSIFNVGDYTFAPWKVVWGRIGNRIEAAVASSAIPQETISLVACSSEQEAHYIAALINSIPFQFTAYSYSQAGGKSFGSPHVLENIRIPQFESDDPSHQQLSQFSRRAHALAPAAYAGDVAAQAELVQVEAEIDRAAARLWGLTEDELDGLRQALSELKGEDSARTDEDDDAEE
jgi:SAM-dependent methyltransferase